MIIALAGGVLALIDGILRLRGKGGTLFGVLETVVAALFLLSHFVPGIPFGSLVLGIATIVVLVIGLILRAKHAIGVTIAALVVIAPLDRADQPVADHPRHQLSRSLRGARPIATRARRPRLNACTVNTRSPAASSWSSTSRSRTADRRLPARGRLLPRARRGAGRDQRRGDRTPVDPDARPSPRRCVAPFPVARMFGFARIGRHGGAPRAGHGARWRDHDWEVMPARQCPWMHLALDEVLTEEVGAAAGARRCGSGNRPVGRGDRIFQSWPTRWTRRAQPGSAPRSSGGSPAGER